MWDKLTWKGKENMLEFIIGIIVGGITVFLIAAVLAADGRD